MKAEERNISVLNRNGSFDVDALWETVTEDITPLKDYCLQCLANKVYAHTKKDVGTGAVLPETEWQPLEEHLDAVARIAQSAAAEFGAGEMAQAAGYLHDIGKATTAFQARLHGTTASVDHKTEGGRIAVERYDKHLGKMLAYIICGHHGGLPDDISCETAAGLDEMLKRQGDQLLCDVPETPKNIMPQKLTASQDKTHQAFYFTMLIRMVFSALVDADYLDTEAFAAPEKSELRRQFPPIAEYCDLFAPKLQELLSYPQDAAVNISRRGVLDACLAAAEKPRGFFKLTVPTGGGKTLSSLAFALKHAAKHDMKRIIYAIPFTSITEQTADVFREIFGGDFVLEHHSNMGADNRTDDENENTHLLACENWDAPLVVTTNVQLFESLFASKPSKARKIHNLANSVIILDEAQTLPDALLKPTLAALKCLVADFGATVVFCTATQPSIKPEWLDGMQAEEIIADTGALFSELSRVQITNLGALADDALAGELRGREQALCIVNTRGHARRLAELLGDEDGYFHLSAVMCPAHRTKTLGEIKKRLEAEQRCVVVSTQLIEAGVDIDFPCVYRALAGIDSIAQAAGRCNREGRRALGDVFVFTPESGLPPGWFQSMAELGEDVMGEYDNPLAPEAIRHFFDMRYGLEKNLDKANILVGIRNGKRFNDHSYKFKKIERDYKLIKDNQISVIIPYDDTAREILRQAQDTMFTAKYLRKLQRYTVSIYSYEFKVLQDRGFIREPKPGMYILNELNLADCYSEKLGLVSDFEMPELIF
jgi:CRISPR-associated helicase Cas3/CRISPR-associated endonuclease Cas3-HD